MRFLHRYMNTENKEDLSDIFKISRYNGFCQEISIKSHTTGISSLLMYRMFQRSRETLEEVISYVI